MYPRLLYLTLSPCSYFLKASLRTIYLGQSFITCCPKKMGKWPSAHHCLFPGNPHDTPNRANPPMEGCVIYTLMECCDGNLTKLASAQGPLDPKNTLLIVSSLAGRSSYEISAKDWLPTSWLEARKHSFQKTKEQNKFQIDRFWVSLQWPDLFLYGSMDHGHSSLHAHWNNFELLQCLGFPQDGHMVIGPYLLLLALGKWLQVHWPRCSLPWPWHM